MTITSRSGPLARGERTPPVALVRASAQFVNGLLVERPDDQSSPSAAKTILIHQS
jgi:hypothetical protein